MNPFTQPAQPNQIIYHSPWHIPLKGKAKCSDGTYRTAWVTGEADTVWTIPARIKVRKEGKTYTIQGHIYWHREAGAPDDTKELRFAAHTYRKNGHILPNWK